MNEQQRRLQETALDGLLRLAGTYGRGPWIPAGEIVAFTQLEANCTHQAAAGALRALRTVRLAARGQTPEGAFWKATDAAAHAGKIWPRSSLGGDGG